jgi:hypothetical protein
MTAQLVQSPLLTFAAASAAHSRRLPVGTALRLSRGGGELVVLEGRVWLTRGGHTGDTGDHVLEPGQRMRLVAGQNAVIEAWDRDQAAVVRWQPQPQGVLAVGQALVLRALAFFAGEAALGLRGLAGGLAALARSAASSASRAQGCINAGDSIACSGALK